MMQLFSFPSLEKTFDDQPEMEMYSSVDCTLSLGTPSTRLTEDHEDHNNRRILRHDLRPVPTYCGWDLLHKTGIGGENNGNGSGSDSHSLLARRCSNCDTTSTPLWRNGPKGPKSLCNACGIRFKKEERRATAANGSSGQTQKLPCFPPVKEYRFGNGNDVRDSDAAVSFLSWRLNVTADRPTSLVHDFII